MILDKLSPTTTLPFTMQMNTGFSHDLKWSSGYQVSFVLEGSVTVNYKNHTREFARNCIWFFAPFENFSFASVDGAKILTLNIDSEFVNSLCPEASQIQFQKNHISYDIADENYNRICKEIGVIIFNNLKNDTCFQMRLLISITNIMILLIENFGRRVTQPITQDYEADRNVQIIQYINAHYQEKLTIAEISAHLSLHPQYFSTYFNRQFQSSFSDYLTSYRINSSINSLIHTSDRILDIALEHGFSNHKTYALAFRKRFGCSPTQYRRSGQEKESPSHLLPGNDSIGRNDIFSFFRQFTDSDSDFPYTSTHLQSQQTLEFDLPALEKRSRSRSIETIFSIGRAYSLLRSQVQNLVLAAKTDLDLRHLKMRDIFSDDLYVYFEDPQKEPVLNWNTLDLIFDFLISNQIHPFPEIGYMPEALSSRKQYSHLQFHPNISYPKSLKRWKLLIRSFLEHFISRYGIHELHQWYFDFWTSPDLDLPVSFWNESMDDFFAFYHATYEVFQEVDPGLRLGTPNFSTISGFPWYEKFFQYCYLNHLYPSHTDIHLYGCEPVKKGNGLETLYEMDIESFSIKNQNRISEYLNELRQIMNRNGFRDMEILVSDWNLIFLPRELIRDTCYMGPYICHTLNQNLFQAKSLCFWTLSDFQEDFFPASELFSGQSGLMDIHGLRKASYNTFALLAKLGSRVLARSDFYMLMKKNNSYQLLIYNLAKFDTMYSLIDKSAIDATHRYTIYSGTNELLLNMLLYLPSGNYYIKKYEVNRNYGSAYDLWSKMGCPDNLHKDEEDYIREMSVPHMTIQQYQVDKVMVLSESVPVHGVLLLEIIPK
ncbi:MAG: GH39 family glycosyl hydrolase [Lachnospiraceae bacterium]